MTRPIRRPAPRRIGRIAAGGKSLLFASLLSVLLIALTASVSSYVYANMMMNEFDTQTQNIETGINTDTDALDDGELNILLLGSDQRPEGDESGVAGTRTDTTMLVHIPDGHDEVYVMSIMRDLWVDIPGHGTGKINGVYDLGGYPLMVDTVEEIIGADIDHMAIIDFEGFRDLTTAMGGVEIDNERAFSAGQVNPSYYPEGRIKIEGTDALRFVRERHAFAEGDYQRVENQQIFLSGLVDQLLARDVLTDPSRLANVIRTFSPYLTVDEGLDAQTMLGHGLSLGNISSNDIRMFTMPNAGPDTTTGGAAIIRQDEEANERMRNALRSGTMSEFLDNYEAEQEALENGADASTESAQPTPETTP